MNEKREYPNSGIFFVNDKKREGKKDADYNGNGEVTCAACGHRNEGWINIWSKVGGRGDFWSWAFKHKDPSRAAAPRSNTADAQRPTGRGLSSGSQQDMGYSRDSGSPQRDRPAQSERRDYGKGIDDEIPF